MENMEEMTKKEMAKKFANRKATITSISTGALLGDIGYGIWDKVVNNFDCAVPVSVLGVVAICVTGYTLMMVNPYTEVVKEEEKENKPKIFRKK